LILSDKFETLGFCKWVIVKPMIKILGEQYKTHGEGFGWAT